MLSNPRPGTPVRLRYRNRAMPHHDATGAVEIAGKGRPRNHAVRLANGTRVVVPAGNLMPLSDPDAGEVSQIVAKHPRKGRVVSQIRPLS